MCCVVVEDDHYDEDEYDEEYYEDGEEVDAAIVEKRAEAKREEEAKAARAKEAAAKKAASKPKAEPAPKKSASSAPSAPLTNVDRMQIEKDNRKMNYDLSAELFGGVEITAPQRPDIKLPNNQTFENFTPTTEAEFQLFAQYVGGHLAVNGVRKHERENPFIHSSHLNSSTTPQKKL